MFIATVFPLDIFKSDFVPPGIVGTDTEGTTAGMADGEPTPGLGAEDSSEEAAQGWAEEAAGLEAVGAEPRPGPEPPPDLAGRGGDEEIRNESNHP